MLKKMVNGEVVEMSAEEESATLAQWAESDAKALEEKPKTLSERIAVLEALLKP